MCAFRWLPARQSTLTSRKGIVLVRDHRLQDHRIAGQVCQGFLPVVSICFILPCAVAWAPAFRWLVLLVDRFAVAILLLGLVRFAGFFL